jgi:hypothetical protein
MAKNKFFIIIAAIIVVAVAVFLRSKYIETPASVREEQKINAIIDGQEAGEVVTYQDGIFSPSKIKIGERSNCILAIANTGNGILKLGLSPHNERGDLGVIYNETPPGETILLDPRYRIERIAYHDHNRPAKELEVELEGACRDF